MYRFTFDASGTIATGGTPQLLLPESKGRAYLYIQNLDPSVDLYFELGGARATATIANGKVTGFTVTNAGFGYTHPPDVLLCGGGNSNNSAYLGVGMVGYPAPGDPGYAVPQVTDLSAQRPARAHAVLTTGAVTSIVIDDPGFGYVAAPYVWLKNTLRDPFGVAIASATSGLLLPAGGGNFSMLGGDTITDAISIFGATTGTRFTCKYMDMVSPR